MIPSSVNKCDKEGYVFWCRLSEMRGSWDCQWLTGVSCRCRKCNGRSILDAVRLAVKVFVGMQDDDLIQKIEEEIANMSDGLDPLEQVGAIDQIVEKYCIDIQEIFQDGEALL